MAKASSTKPKAKAAPKADRVVRIDPTPKTSAPKQPPPWTDFTDEEMRVWPPRFDKGVEPDDVIASRLATREQRWRYNASMVDKVTLDDEPAIVYGVDDLAYATVRSISTSPNARRHSVRIPWVELYKLRRLGYEGSNFKAADWPDPEPAEATPDDEPPADRKPKSGSRRPRP